MATQLTGWKRTHMCGAISEEMIGQEVCLMGWVQRERNLGSLVFVDCATARAWCRWCLAKR